MHCHSLLYLYRLYIYPTVRTLFLPLSLPFSIFFDKHLNNYKLLCNTQHTHTQKLSFYFSLIHRQCLRWYDRPDWMQSLKSGLLINAENMENKWYCMQKSWPRSRVVNENIHTIGLYCLLIICSFATQSINCNVENKKKAWFFFVPKQKS